MSKEGHSGFFVGIDWGATHSQTTTNYWARGSDGRAYSIHPNAYREFHQLDEKAKARKMWGALLLIDFKIGTTTGAQQQHWLKAKRYLALGRDVVVGWKQTTS